MIGGLEFKLDHVTWSRPFQGRSVVLCRLGPCYVYVLRRYERQRKIV